MSRLLILAAPLPAPQLGVESPLDGEELRVGAGLRHPAVVDDKDAVSALNRAEAMSDGDRGAALLGTIQGLLYYLHVYISTGACG